MFTILVWVGRSEWSSTCYGSQCSDTPTVDPDDRFPWDQYYARETGIRFRHRLCQDLSDNPVVNPEFKFPPDVLGDNPVTETEQLHLCPVNVNDLGKVYCFIYNAMPLMLTIP